MLYLNKHDMKQAVTMKEIINAIDLAYRIYESEQFQMPNRMQITENDNTLLLMPCYSPDSIATKLVTVFPNNKKHPTLHGLVILNCSQTGKIKSLLDGTFLTGIRTGAVGGSAIRHLAHKNIQKVAIIGAGTQGLYQAIAACTVRPITDIYVYSRTQNNIPSFIEKLKKWIDANIHIHPKDSVEKAIKNAEVIITATTSSKPVLPDKPSLFKNKLFIGVGSYKPTMQEFPKSLYEISDHIFIDAIHAIKESGDLAIPLQQELIKRDCIQTMSSFITNQAKNIIHQEKSIIFKTVGMALFDTVVANIIYQKAIEKGIGKKLTT